jgi:DNA repair protein RadD
MLRPTASTALWVQMLGRGTRPSYATGKENCLVLDFAGNTMRLGPINNPKIPGKVKKGGGGEAPVRICPECFTYNHASAPVCCMCGFEFPIREKLSDEASKLKLIARKDDELDEEIETFKPHHVAYTSHLKQKNGPACLLVEYQCSGLVIKNYLPWEHGGKASFIADKWWQARFDTPRPPTVDEVLRSINAGLQIPLPLGIEVNMANRYKSKIQPKLKKEIWK